MTVGDRTPVCQSFAEGFIMKNLMHFNDKAFDSSGTLSWLWTPFSSRGGQTLSLTDLVSDAQRGLSTR
jgi:hypothetical protein